MMHATEHRPGNGPGGAAPPAADPGTDTGTGTSSTLAAHADPHRRQVDWPPVHPGEILMQEFLEPMGLSQYRVAKDVSVPPRRINEIVHGKRAITADTALRLARFFGTSARFWLELQVQHDLEVEREKLGRRLEREVTPWAGGD